MRSCTTSTKAATSWSVTFSRSSTSATKTSSTTGALARQVAASSAGTTPSGGLGLGGQQLDLEPEREAGGVAEEGGHVGRRVARDHPAPSRAAYRGAGHAAPRCRGASACPPSRSAPRRRRRARAPRRASGRRAVTPSTRPPAVWNGPSASWRPVPAWNTVTPVDRGRPTGPTASSPSMASPVRGCSG